MMDYIRTIQRKMIDQYGFPENPNFPGTVLGDVPNGTYPMTINGKLDNVRIEDGNIHCCNFDNEIK